MKMKKSKLLYTIIIVVLLFVGFGLITTIACNMFKKDEELKEDYETREAKIELLYKVSDECIIEGERIAFENIKNDNVKYTISNQNENIILNYYIISENYAKNKDNPYKATIILTKDYNVISKEFGIKSITFEEYVRVCDILTIILSCSIALVSLLLICFIIYMISYIIKKVRGKI